MPQPAVAVDRVMHGVSSNSPLPPSVETAYYRKCIELKRRVNEIEENNDVLRVRKVRIERAILKMRMERGLLLERIAHNMKDNQDDSDESNSPPPTPQDKPLRSKRGHRSKATPPPTGSAAAAANHTSPPAGGSGASQGAFLAGQDQTTPEAASRLGQQQFFNAYPQPPISTPPALAAAPVTPAPAALNGTPMQLAPPPGATPQPYDPAYDDGGENGDSASTTAPSAAFAPVNPAPVTSSETPRVEQNGQADKDTEMGEAGADEQGGFGGGFTAVNR